MSYIEEFLNDKEESKFEVRLDHPHGRKIHTDKSISGANGWIRKQTELGKYTDHDFIIMLVKSTPYYAHIKTGD